jgi:flagellar biosynthesis regulator FlaF
MQYARAAYRRRQDAHADPRITEITAFGVVNRALETAETPAARREALGRSHALWHALVLDLSSPGNRLPEALRTQLLDLGAWAMRYSTQALLRDLPVAPLVEVHRNLADGLREQVAAAEAGAALSGLRSDAAA